MGEIRQKYPQYNDMSDQQLADSLYDKHYSDMDKNEYYSKVGLKEQPSERPLDFLSPKALGLEAIHGMGNVAAGLTSGVQAVRNLPHTLANLPHNLYNPIPGTPKSWESQENLLGRLWHDPNDRGEIFRPKDQSLLGKMTEGAASWIPATMLGAGLSKAAGVGGRASNILGSGFAGVANMPEHPYIGATLGAGGAAAAPYAAGAIKKVPRLLDFIRPGKVVKEFEKMASPAIESAVKKPSSIIYNKYEKLLGEEPIYQNYNPANSNRALYEETLEHGFGGKKYRDVAKLSTEKKFSPNKSSLTKEEMNAPYASKYTNYNNIPLEDIRKMGMLNSGSPLKSSHSAYVNNPNYLTSRNLQQDLFGEINSLNKKAVRSGLERAEREELNLLRDARNALKKDTIDMANRKNPAYGKEMMEADKLHRENVVPYYNYKNIAKTHMRDGKINAKDLSESLYKASTDKALQAKPLPKKVIKMNEKYRGRVKAKKITKTLGAIIAASAGLNVAGSKINRLISGQ